MSASTLHAALDKTAADHPAVELTFPGARTAVSLEALSRGSARAAVALRERGVRPGDRVGLMCANEPAFLLTLFALSRLGACAVPLPLPTTSRDGYPAKVQGILACGQVSDVVVSGQLARMRSFLGTALHGVRQLDADGLLDGGGPEVADEPDADGDVIVQFTSGSTAQPKGVRLSHRNVLACLEAIRAGMAVDPAVDRGGMWLPLFHDMGLFGTLAGLLTGLPVTVWPSSAFVKDPARWLRRFADGGHTVTALPNFGYDYLRDAVPADEVAGYDLSRWRCALNGAEPIAADSLESFLAHFAPAGFRPDAMLPVYGLAEATLAVTFAPLHRAPRVDWVDRARLAGSGEAVPVHRDEPGARGIVSVGTALTGMTVRITGPATGAVLGERQITGPATGAVLGERQITRPATGAMLGERMVGEIELRGDSVTAGYLDTDADGPVTQPFTADGWLRTGDLGYLAGGELHVTGRLKEMMIVRGENFYPDDVESAVRSEPDVHQRRCVAFVDEVDGRERMTLVAETAVSDAGHRAGLVARMRGLVVSRTGLDDVRIVLVNPQSIPRTSSGKLQRLAARSQFGSR